MYFDFCRPTSQPIDSGTGKVSALRSTPPGEARHLIPWGQEGTGGYGSIMQRSLSRVRGSRKGPLSSYSREVIIHTKSILHLRRRFIRSVFPFPSLAQFPATPSPGRSAWPHFAFSWALITAPHIPATCFTVEESSAIRGIWPSSQRRYPGISDHVSRVPVEPEQP